MNEREKKEIQRIRFFANKNVLDHEALVDTIEGRKKPIGDDLNHVATTDHFRVVFSFEQQPAGLVRHVSISQLDSQQPLVVSWPPTGEFKEILDELGFKEFKLDDTMMWVEKQFDALNIVQIAEPPLTPTLSKTERDWAEKEAKKNPRSRSNR